MEQKNFLHESHDGPALVLYNTYVGPKGQKANDTFYRHFKAGGAVYLCHSVGSNHLVCQFSFSLADKNFRPAFRIRKKV